MVLILSPKLIKNSSTDYYYYVIIYNEIIIIISVQEKHLEEILNKTYQNDAMKLTIT